MNKLLLTCLITLTSLTGCSKPTKVVYEHFPTTMMLTLGDCPTFVDDSDYTLKATILACQAAHFERLTIKVQEINEYVYVINVSDTKGYASVWVDTELKSCVVEFFCLDGSYSYEDFIGVFMSEFDAAKDRSDTWMDELMELWEQEEKL